MIRTACREQPMTALIAKARTSLLWLPARLLWVGMLLAHLPATLSAFQAVGSQPGGWMRCLLLLASHVLFALKILDVPWLRLPSNPRVWIALLICVVMLHAGPLVREHAVPAADLESWQAIIVVASVLSLAGVLDAAQRRREKPFAPPSLRRRHLAHDSRPRPQLAALTCLSSRAPPLN